MTLRGIRLGTTGRERCYASTTDTYDESEALDFIAIERVLNGEPARLTMAERLYAARILDAQGLTETAIAHQVGCRVSTIQKWKANGWRRGGPAKQPKPKRPEPTCGEARMYRLHLKRGENCDVCRAANAAADRRYRLTGSRVEALGGEQP
jgi:hypothetical protein